MMPQPGIPPASPWRPQYGWPKPPPLLCTREYQSQGGPRGVMATQSSRVQPPTRRSHPPRRVVLESVARRDAAQRLSLALALLARLGEAPHVPASPALEYGGSAGACPGIGSSVSQEDPIV